MAYAWDSKGSDRNAHDYTVYKDGKVLGHLRLKPSGIAWRPKGVHSGLGNAPYRRIPIEEIERLAEEHGEPVDK